MSPWRLSSNTLNRLKKDFSLCTARNDPHSRSATVAFIWKRRQVHVLSSFLCVYVYTHTFCHTTCVVRHIAVCDVMCFPLRVVLQCVLQYVAMCVAVCCCVLHCVLQCVAVCVVVCVAVFHKASAVTPGAMWDVLQYALQYVLHCAGQCILGHLPWP